ncbi:hypothetical protein IJ670_06250 [bacterium]|nr:hypothetical protein [bacterium]
MLKRILPCICLGFALVFLTGCAKIASTIEIKDNDKVVISQIAAINLDTAKQLFPDMEYNRESKSYLKNKEELQEKGFIVQEYDDEDGYSGVQAYKDTTAKKLRAEALPQGFEVAGDADMPIQVEKSTFKTKYTIHLNFDASKIDGVPKRPVVAKKRAQRTKKAKKAEQENLENTLDPAVQQNMENVENGQNGEINVEENMPNDLEDEANGVDVQQAELWKKIDEIYKNPETRPAFSLTIKIPKKASENNATEVKSSREYRWELTTDKPTEIILKYEKFNFFSFVIAVLIVFGTLTFISRNKKYIIKSEEEDTKNAF